MNRILKLVAVAGGCLVASAAALAAIQQQQPAKSPAELGKQVGQGIRGGMSDPAGMEAAMNKWMETMKPGPAHEFLTAAFVGDWNVETKMWMDPAGEPQTSKGTTACKPLFGGRYVRETFKGDMMGQPFEGEGTTGFDNNKKLFVSTWMDSMGTGIMVMKGSISEDGKTLTLVGEMDEPMTGEVGKPIMMKVTVESPDRHVSTMYEILYGEPVKVMEMTYTRAKPAGGTR